MDDDIPSAKVFGSLFGKPDSAGWAEVTAFHDPKRRAFANHWLTLLAKVGGLIELKYGWSGKLGKSPVTVHVRASVGFDNFREMLEAAPFLVYERTRRCLRCQGTRTSNCLDCQGVGRVLVLVPE